MGQDNYTIIFVGRPCTQDEIDSVWNRLQAQVMDSDQFDADCLGFWGLHEGMEQTQFVLDGFPIVLHAYGTSPSCIDESTDPNEYLWFVMQKLLHCSEENTCIDPKDIPKPHDDRYKLWVLSDFSV